MTAEAPTCTVLEWDSAFFELRMARVDAGQLDTESTRDCVEWGHAHDVDLLCFLVQGSRPESGWALQAAGARHVDTRMTLARPLSEGPGSLPEGVSFGSRSHLERLVPIARASHLDSRFYHDERLARDRCDDLYETWLRNSFEGYARAVLVGWSDGLPAGYLTCHLHEKDAVGQIGLIAVNRSASGQGLGRALVQASLAWFADAGASSVRVVTQSRNVAALRLYERNGFVMRSAAEWYHLWIRDTDR